MTIGQVASSNSFEGEMAGHLRFVARVAEPLGLSGGLKPPLRDFFVGLAFLV